MNTYKSGYAIFRYVHWSLRRRKMTIATSQITGQSIVCSAILLTLTTKKQQIKGPLYCPFERGTHRWPVDTPPKGTTWKMFPFEDVIVYLLCTHMIHVNVTPVKNSMAKLKAV